MRGDERHNKVKYCLDAGYRIYVRPINSYNYRIVVSKATKYKWSEIPNDKKKGFEEVDGIIYNVKVGEVIYRSKPKGKEDKWWEKIPQLYESIYEKLIINNKKQQTKDE